MGKNCLITSLKDKVSNFKLPYYVDSIDYSSLANNISYNIGKYWQNNREEEASAGKDSFASVAPISLSTHNGVFVSCKGSQYRVAKLSAKVDGAYSSYMGEGQFYGYKGAVDYDGEVSLYITIEKADGTPIPANVNFGEILDIRSQNNPYINNGLIIASTICNNESDGDAWYAASDSYDYAILNYASIGYKLYRKYSSSSAALDVDAEREKTVLVDGKYYRYNGSKYVELL